MSGDIEATVPETMKNDLPEGMKVPDGFILRLLRQSDYARGTLKLTSNTFAVLMEDVTFHPNPEFDFKPSAAQLESGEYDAVKNQFGFVTMHEMVGENIVLHLNGHVIRQSDEHALQQRFFSLVQLGDAPFIAGTGPADHGTFHASRGCVVRGAEHGENDPNKWGTIALSSHHGIQGNNCTNILLERLRFRDFEVGAIALNRPRNVTIRDIVIGPNRQDIPVLASYSHSRFALDAIDRLLGNPDVPVDIRAEAVQARQALRDAVDEVRGQVLKGVPVTNPLFANPVHVVDGIERRLLDGTSYAIVLHGKGPAVNAFSGDSVGDRHELGATGVTLENIQCTTAAAAGGGIVSAPRHIVGISDVAAQRDETVSEYGKGVQHDSAGAVLDIHTITDPDTGLYIPNPLADVQSLLAEHRKYLSSVEAARITISPGIIQWMRHNTGGGGEVKANTLSAVMNRDALRLVMGGDSMFHVHKGVMAYRFDNVHGLWMRNVEVCDVRNLGDPPVSPAWKFLPALLDAEDYASSVTTFQHPMQKLSGYQGFHARGMVFSGCSDVCRHAIHDKGVIFSAHGDAITEQCLYATEVIPDRVPAAPHHSNVQAPNGNAITTMGFENIDVVTKKKMYGPSTSSVKGGCPMNWMMLAPTAVSQPLQHPPQSNNSKKKKQTSQPKKDHVVRIYSKTIHIINEF